MVVEVSKNSSNSSIHYGPKPVVGLINDVPDKIERQDYYSRSESIKRFNKAHHDVYVKTLNAPKPKKDGVPTVLKILGGAVGTISLLLWGKSIGKGLMTFIKNLPK